MKVTLDLTETEAIFVRDALIDKSIALRTDDKDRIIREDVFMDDPSVSERRKDNYHTLRTVANIISHRIR